MAMARREADGMFSEGFPVSINAGGRPPRGAKSTLDLEEDELPLTNCMELKSITNCDATPPLFNKSGPASWSGLWNFAVSTPPNTIEPSGLPVKRIPISAWHSFEHLLCSTYGNRS